MSLTIEELEAELRATWTAQGVTQERQDEILAETAYKASPEYMMSLFPPRESVGMFFSYHEGYSYPASISTDDKAQLDYIWGAYSFLLNTSDLRRRRVPYTEFAAIIRAYSSHERSEWCAALLDRINNSIS